MSRTTIVLGSVSIAPGLLTGCPGYPEPAYKSKRWWHRLFWFVRNSPFSSPSVVTGVNTFAVFWFYVAVLTVCASLFGHSDLDRDFWNNNDSSNVQQRWSSYPPKEFLLNMSPYAPYGDPRLTPKWVSVTAGKGPLYLGRAVTNGGLHDQAAEIRWFVAALKCIILHLIQHYQNKNTHTPARTEKEGDILGIGCMSFLTNSHITMLRLSLVKKEKHDGCKRFH